MNYSFIHSYVSHIFIKHIPSLCFVKKKKKVGITAGTNNPYFIDIKQTNKRFVSYVSFLLMTAWLGSLFIIMSHFSQAGEATTVCQTLVEQKENVLRYVLSLKTSTHKWHMSWHTFHWPVQDIRCECEFEFIDEKHNKPNFLSTCLGIFSCPWVK